MKCRLIAKQNAYEVVTPFDMDFVTELKNTIPQNSRSYDPNTHRWSVSAQYGDAVAALIGKCFSEWVDVPVLQRIVMVGIIELLYLGQTKDRGNGERTAYGYTKAQGALMGAWNIVFPENVLKAYFDPSYTEQKERPAFTTYYETLGIKANAKPEEIRSGYRRMVRQWHPDVCKDPDAHEMFISIQKAYETLNNPKLKARYDVGLKLELGNAKKVKKSDDFIPYRSPLKCGNLLCEYTPLGVKKHVTKIMQWEDIYDKKGRALVSSWGMGDAEPTLEWR